MTKRGKAAASEEAIDAGEGRTALGWGIPCLTGCDGFYDGIRKLFTMSGVAVICSLNDTQFVVGYKLCKLICIFHWYDLIS